VPPLPPQHLRSGCGPTPTPPHAQAVSRSSLDGFYYPHCADDALLHPFHFRFGTDRIHSGLLDDGDGGTGISLAVAVTTITQRWAARTAGQVMTRVHPQQATVNATVGGRCGMCGSVRYSVSILTKRPIRWASRATHCGARAAPPGALTAFRPSFHLHWHPTTVTVAVVCCRAGIYAVHHTLCVSERCCTGGLNSGCPPGGR